MMRRRTPASELTLGHVRTVPGDAVGHAIALITSAISRAGPASHARETLVPENVLERCAGARLIHRTRTGTTIVRRRELLDRWLSSYADILRPAWTVGRYRTQITDPELLEREIANAFGDHVWALGGGAAAWRMTHYYRGPDTVLHVHELPSDALKAIRAIPARDGTLTILRVPGDVPYRGTTPHTAHPLLAYAEMISSSDPRMNEAANELREKFLTELM